MVTDRVGDFIIRLKNAAMIGKRDVVLPYSTYIFAIAKKLKELGFLTEIKVSDEEHKTLKVTLAFNEKGESKLRGVRRVSKPGRRLYAGHTRAHTVKGGTGARIISSSTGIISDSEARKNRIGGEELFEIW